jgi:hypothetical protein
MRHFISLFASRHDLPAYGPNSKRTQRDARQLPRPSILPHALNWWASILMMLSNSPALFHLKADLQIPNVVGHDSNCNLLDFIQFETVLRPIVKLRRLGTLVRRNGLSIFNCPAIFQIRSDARRTKCMASLHRGGELRAEAPTCIGSLARRTGWRAGDFKQRVPI